VIRRILIAVLLLGCSLTVAQAKQVTTKTRAIVYSQQLIDAGELVIATEFLNRAVIKFPRNDNLWSLYGQALYESRQIDTAEDAFRKALRINPLNKMAKTYVEVIRETSIATTSLEAQVFESVVWDKLGDIVVLALGFFLGSLMSVYYRKFNERRFVLRSRQLFKVGEYEDYADMLEIQLAENNLRPLRRSLGFMLEHKSMEESAQILSEHVNSEENLNTLIRMIKLNETHQS